MCQTEKGKAPEHMPKQPISETLALGQDEAAKSYTPYIKYTKLEFKVHKFLFLLFVISFYLYVVVVYYFLPTLHVIEFQIQMVEGRIVKNFSF